MNPKVQNALRVVVIGGSAVIGVSAVYSLFTNKLSAKSAIPVITALVAISAFTYAINNGEISIVPKV